MMEKHTENLFVPSAMPKADVDEEKSQLLRPNGHSSKRYYGFRVGNMGLLTLPEGHSECLRNHPVYFVPNTQPWFRGVINLRGGLIPIFDLDRLIFSENKAMTRRIVLILDEGENAVGILVREYPCAIDGLRPLLPLPAIPGVIKGYCLEAYTAQGNIWMEFNYRRFFHSLSPKIPIANQIYQ